MNSSIYPPDISILQAFSNNVKKRDCLCIFCGCVRFWCIDVHLSWTCWFCNVWCEAFKSAVICELRSSHMAIQRTSVAL